MTDLSVALRCPTGAVLLYLLPLRGGTAARPGRDLERLGLGRGRLRVNIEATPG